MYDAAPITWFTDDPTPILAAGGIALLVLLVVLLKTGRGVILMAMMGVALCMGLAVLIDALVVTEREQVEDVIYQAARAAKHNNLDAVVQVISPTATELREEARRWIGQMKIESVSVGGLQINTNHETKPATATAGFWVRAEGEARRGDTIYRTYFGRLKVDFQFENGRWLVVDYERE